MATSNTIFRELLVDDLEPRVLAARNKVEISQDTLERAESLLDGKQLNSSQRAAALGSLTSRTCTIQGPPGTGKTTTCVRIVELNKDIMAKEDPRILVSAHTNSAVDELGARMVKYGLPAGRFGHARKVADAARVNLMLS